LQFGCLVNAVVWLCATLICTVRPKHLVPFQLFFKSWNSPTRQLVLNRLSKWYFQCSCWQLRFPIKLICQNMGICWPCRVFKAWKTLYSEPISIFWKFYFWGNLSYVFKCENRLQKGLCSRYLDIPFLLTNDQFIK
jgi:hypothetical protein